MEQREGTKQSACGMLPEALKETVVSPHLHLPILTSVRKRKFYVLLYQFNPPQHRETTWMPTGKGEAAFGSSVPQVL